MNAQLALLLARLPGKATPQWPEGERFVTAFAHGTIRVLRTARRRTRNAR